jgi:hypothetical protein
MKQSRWASLLESALSTTAGFGLAILLQATVLPLLLGAHVSAAANLGFAGVMTVASIARQYIMRRLFEGLGLRFKMSPAMVAVIAERRRQIDVEGFDADHDDKYSAGELATAAACYALYRGANGYYRRSMRESNPPPYWSWPLSWWKPRDFRRDLVRAAALIMADIERGDRNRLRDMLAEKEERRQLLDDGASRQWTPAELEQWAAEREKPPIVTRASLIPNK